ncbi:hypothetical protein [Streptomyces sp. NPDC047718]|uniref:hypothetical protein n=1 Tax=Streptomyces sp. NPDC047718 TaxID=3155479 RepID=UPI0033E15BC7
MSEHTDVAVVGGGYADVMAVDRLVQRDGVRVTVVYPRPDSVPRLRLHQFVAGTHDAVVDHGPRARRTTVERLVRLGVTVLDGPGTGVTAVTRDAVALVDGGRWSAR